MTAYSALDMDSSGNIVAGGGTLDSVIAPGTTSTSWTALIVYLNSDGSYKWTQYYTAFEHI